MPWEAFFAAVWFPVAAVVLVRMFWAFDRDARLVVQTAASIATRHGHDVIESTHVALALTADEKIAAELEARGVDVAKLYGDLEAALPPFVEPPTKQKDVRWSEDVTRVLARASKRRVITTRARMLLVSLLHDDWLASAVLVRHWSGSTHSRHIDDAAGPYRGRSVSAKPAWALRIWNDDRTTMDFVVTTLHDSLMLREANAIHAMFVTHYAGSAVVHRCEREEAERLAKLIGDAAIAQGFPLRVTAEEITDSRR